MFVEGCYSISFKLKTTHFLSIWELQILLDWSKASRLIFRTVIPNEFKTSQTFFHWLLLRCLVLNWNDYNLKNQSS